MDDAAERVPELPDVTHCDVNANGVRLHYVLAGEETADPARAAARLPSELADVAAGLARDPWLPATSSSRSTCAATGTRRNHQGVQGTTRGLRQPTSTP